VDAAVEQAAFGDAAQARPLAADALRLAPTSSGVEAEAALAFAMAGDSARAESLPQDLEKRFPQDSQMQSLWLPAIQAQLALNKNDPAAALKALQVVSAIELGTIEFDSTHPSCLFQVYLRGETYLAAGRGDAAATEFHKILDHRGIVWNCWTGALAHLGLARANALQARGATNALVRRDAAPGHVGAAASTGWAEQSSAAISSADRDAARVRALAAYKDFLALWKDADPDIHPQTSQSLICEAAVETLYTHRTIS
jgi:eukaryotic-like serine/threonine-protein kinase